MTDNLEYLDKYSNNKNIVTGFSIAPKIEKPASEFPEYFESDLALALTTFENAGDSFYLQILLQF